jgi:hypothetical protein
MRDLLDGHTVKTEHTTEYWPVEPEPKIVHRYMKKGHLEDINRTACGKEVQWVRSEWLMLFKKDEWTNCTNCFPSHHPKLDMGKDGYWTPQRQAQIKLLAEQSKPFIVKRAA